MSWEGSSEKRLRNTVPEDSNLRSGAKQGRLMCGMARNETTGSGDRAGEQPASPPGVSSHDDAS